MTGNLISLGKVLVPITDMVLWRACKTEEEYFTVLRIKQRKNNTLKPGERIVESPDTTR